MTLCVVVGLLLGLAYHGSAAQSKCPQPVKKPPQVCLNMIIKDDIARVPDFYKSLEGLINCWVIVDIGSSDGTQKKVKEVFGKIKSGVLLERKFDHFEGSRTHALEEAKKKYPDAWLLLLDTDMKLEVDEYSHCSNDAKWAVLQKTLNDAPKNKAFLVEQGRHTWKYSQLRLIRSSDAISYQGYTHGAQEHIIIKDKMENDLLPSNGLRIVQETMYQHQLLKDARLYEDEILVRPHNQQAYYHLGDVYHYLGQYENAVKNYEHFLEMPKTSQTSDQETYMVLMNLAWIRESQFNENEKAAHAWVQAHDLIPDRVEAIYQLSRHFRKRENHAVALAQVELAIERAKLPEPKDGLFVDKSVREHRIDYETAVIFSWKHPRPKPAAMKPVFDRLKKSGFYEADHLAYLESYYKKTEL